MERGTQIEPGDYNPRTFPASLSRSFYCSRDKVISQIGIIEVRRPKCKNRFVLLKFFQQVELKFQVNLRCGLSSRAVPDLARRGRRLQTLKQIIHEIRVSLSGLRRSSCVQSLRELREKPRISVELKFDIKFNRNSFKNINLFSSNICSLSQLD